MHWIGVDLAWGDRAPTGLAVLDEHGRLVHLGVAGTDQEIVDAVRPFTRGDCLVAIDGPLVVPNATGNRPAEAALNRDFARFDAGAHPVNSSRPEFAQGPRGARLAAALEVPPDDGRPGRRQAIEVYPHAAAVALFGLGRTLKYKNKPGRDLTTLRSELLRLTGLLADLEHADPPLQLGGPAWTAAVEAVRSAARKSELRAVEDQVDAVLCAYVARFTSLRPEAVTRYGEPASGSILTPTLPPGQLPTPRSAPAAPPVEVVPAADRVRGAVQAYAAAQPELAIAGEAFVALVRAILDDAGINYLSVSGRVKTVASFAEKAGRTLAGRPLFNDPLKEITDVLGVRVITYTLSDVDTVAHLLDDQVVVKDDRDLGRQTASEGRFGYSSRHLLVALDAARESEPEYQVLRGRVASVQIRTVLQHAWAEFEHDIRYKGTVPAEHAREFDRRFTLAAGLLELADQEFSAIRDRLTSGPSEPAAPDDDPRIDPRELAAFLAGQFADAGWSRTDHYTWMSGLLLELGITSLDELAEVVRPTVHLNLNTRMDYRYPPGAVRRLDDALLAAFGDTYVSLRGNGHRVAALRSRLGRLAAAP